MLNPDFWMLLGSVSTTLAAFAFVGLAIFYERAKEALAEFRNYGLEPISTITFAKIINYLIYSLTPLMLSLIMIMRWTGIARMLLPFLVMLSILSYIWLYRFRKIDHSFLEIHLPGISAVVLTLSCAILLFFTDKITVLAAIELVAVVMLALGVLFDVATLKDFYEVKAVFKITEETRLLAREPLDNLKGKINAQFRVLNRVKHRIKVNHAEIVKDLEIESGKLRDRINSLNELSQESQLTYLQFKKAFNEFKSIAREAEKIKAWIKLQNSDSEGLSRMDSLHQASRL